MTENMNMDLNEEALPPVDESELGFSNKIAPAPEGIYAVKSKLGANGMKFDAVKKTYTIHAVNEILKPLKFVSPLAAGVVVDEDKLFKKKDGAPREIHDFFRINAANTMGINKARGFLKAAGDDEYAKYRTVPELAKAVEDALKQQPDALKLNGRWTAGVEVGKDAVTGKPKYETVRGMKRFPLKEDGSRNHVIVIDDEQVGAQLEVVGYETLTEKDVA